MAAGVLTESTATLRAATYRLSSTPTKQLPYIAPQIASQLWACKDLLASTPDTAKQNNETSITVHRFKTHLSTLLQDRTIEGRWAAVVLVKAAVEAGGVEVLSKSNAWVRSLLGVLKKPDPPTTRTLAVITLTRIFMLTWDYSNLVREITTPALPGFVSTCLSNVESKRCSKGELQTVLEAFATLMPRHPTIFRTSETQLRTLLTRVISTTSSAGQTDVHHTKEHRNSAHRLLVLLHHCSPKQGSPEKWDETLKTTVTAAHATCDRLFRSIVETWKSNGGIQPSAAPGSLLHGDVELESDTALGLSGWKGIYAGGERLTVLLDQLKSQIVLSTSTAVTVRLGLAVDLLSRIFSIRVPQGKHNTLQANHQISKEERDDLFRTLPYVHVAGMELVTALLGRFGNGATSIIHPMLGDVLAVFDVERANDRLRAATYTCLCAVLRFLGMGMEKHDITDLEKVIRSCCNDLIPNDSISSPGASSANGGTSKGTAANGDIGLQAIGSKITRPTAQTDLKFAAKSLLPLCLSQINAQCLSGKLRALMDRTAVLTQNRDALVASVLNPSSKSANGSAAASLLPLLARQYPNVSEVEALLRPRMPVIRRAKPAEADESEGETEDDESMADVEGDAQGGEQLVADGLNEAEPTDGLLSALGQNSTAADEGELYSASPAPVLAPASSDSAPEKRRADAIPETSRPAKRLQASPIAESLLPSVPSNLPGPDPVTTQTAVLTTVVSEQLSSSFVTAPERSQSQQAITGLQAPASSSALAGDAKRELGGDEEGSDFEMPPLTMESSDEGEDE